MTPPTGLEHLQGLPLALQSPYPLGQPNEPIMLYTGPAKFTQKAKTFEAVVQIALDWLPSPRIEFSVPSVPSGVSAAPGDLSLRLDDGTVIPHARATGVSYAGGPEGLKCQNLSGVIGERVVRSTGASATYAVFAVPNFDQPMGKPIAYPDRSSRAHRLTLSGGGWKVTLDAADNFKEAVKRLDASSGFAVTQVGKLEKDDGEPFTADDAIAALIALEWYISFAYGRWTGPFLPKGFDANGSKVWEVWHKSRAVPYRYRQAWLDRIHGDQFEAPFAGFMRRWRDEAWEEVVRVAIHWYVEANAQAGSIEGSIVLTQTAFELLAAGVLVENFGWLSSDGYDKLPAADRIRLLLSWAGIPTAIPAELDDLDKLAKADNWPDTPTAMTMIRNTITHPTKKNREKFGRHTHAARVDAWTLGLWNLELCLLRLFDYRGTYANRITQEFQGEACPVPWA
jgi:hypothetical protein